MDRVGWRSAGVAGDAEDRWRSLLYREGLVRRRKTSFDAGVEPLPPPTPKALCSAVPGASVPCDVCEAVHGHREALRAWSAEWLTWSRRQAEVPGLRAVPDEVFCNIRR